MDKCFICKSSENLATTFFCPTHMLIRFGLWPMVSWERIGCIGLVRKELHTLSSIKVDKRLKLIPLATFSVTCKERSRKIFEGRKSNFDRFKNLCSRLRFLLRDHSLHTSENLEDLIDILVDFLSTFLFGFVLP